MAKDLSYLAAIDQIAQLRAALKPFADMATVALRAPGDSPFGTMTVEISYLLFAKGVFDQCDQEIEVQSVNDWKLHCLSALKLLHEALDVIEAIDSECMLPGQLKDMVDAALAPRLQAASAADAPTAPMKAEKAQQPPD